MKGGGVLRHNKGISIRRPGPLSSRALLALIVALLAVAVYANSLGNGFAYDDVHIILENERVHSLSNLPEAITTPYWPGEMGRDLGLWRPLTIVSFASDWTAFRGEPLGFHAVNVALHALASVLVLLLLAELIPLAGAAAGALVFAVHPVHVEAVANVVGRAELLMTVFALAACLLLLRSDPGRVGAVIGITALYAAAFLSKETGIVLPAIFLLVEMARGEVGRVGGWLAYARRRLPLFAVLAGVGIGLLLLRWTVLGSIASATAPLGAAELQSVKRLWTVVSVWPHYLRLIFWPVGLSADYSPNVIPILTGVTPRFLLGLLSGVAVLTIAAISWRGRPLSSAGESTRAISTGIVFFMIAVLPAANVFFLSGVLLAERTLYLPSVGAVLGAGWLVDRVARRAPGAGAALLATALILLGIGTVRRNPVWLNSATVFETIVRDHPESGRAQWLLGQAYFKEESPEEGMRAYERALSVLGPHYPLLTDIGRDLISVGREDEGAQYLLRAYLLRPDLKAAPHRLMRMFAGLHRYDEAVQMAKAVVRVDSMDTVAHHLLASIYADQGRIDDAIEARRRTIVAGEGARWQQWYWLAELLSNAERHADAGEALDSAWTRAADADARDAVRRLRQQVDQPGSLSK